MRSYHRSSTRSEILQTQTTLQFYSGTSTLSYSGSLLLRMPCPFLTLIPTIPLSDWPDCHSNTRKMKLCSICNTKDQSAHENQERTYPFTTSIACNHPPSLWSLAPTVLLLRVISVLNFRYWPNATSAQASRRLDRLGFCEKGGVDVWLRVPDNKADTANGRRQSSVITERGSASILCWEFGGGVTYHGCTMSDLCVIF